MSATRSHPTPEVEPWDVKITPQMVQKVSMAVAAAPHRNTLTTRLQRIESLTG